MWQQCTAKDTGDHQSFWLKPQGQDCLLESRKYHILREDLTWPIDLWNWNCLAKCLTAQIWVWIQDGFIFVKLITFLWLLHISLGYSVDVRKHIISITKLTLTRSNHRTLPGLYFCVHPRLQRFFLLAIMDQWRRGLNTGCDNMDSQRSKHEGTTVHELWNIC